jgi:pimeloyl-ACP methyl ester carboxylesterase
VRQVGDVRTVAGVQLSTVVVGGGPQMTARLAEPVASPAGGCPVVAFGHGFVQRPLLYDSLLAGVAARGYVVVAPDTETGPWPRHERLADDLWRVARWAREVRAWPGEGSGIALAGHSMGAGVAILAASRHPEAEAVVTLAALQTRPPAQLEAVAAPSLFVVGSQDRIVPPSRTRPLYEAVAGPAHWAEIRGGYHCGFLDRARWRDLACDGGDLPRREQLAITVRLVGTWLDARFRGGTFTAPPGVDLEVRSRSPE